MRRLAIGVALLLCACGGSGPDMRPGEDCQRCHGGGSGKGGRIWTFAGTVYAAADAAADAGVLDARVHVTDANGWSFMLRTNAAGNFYSAESVTFPLKICIERGGAEQCQVSAITSGACNSCHGAGNRIWVP
jgi:hypothetical protein